MKTLKHTYVSLKVRAFTFLVYPDHDWHASDSTLRFRVPIGRPFEYAILASPFNPETDYFGTCLNCDDILQVVGYEAMMKALSRINNKDIYNSIRQNIPKAQLRDLLHARRQLVDPSLTEIIQEMEQAYMFSLEAKARSIKKKMKPEGVAQQKKVKRKTKKTHKKKVAVAEPPTDDIIKDGSDVAAFYYDCEMNPGWAQNEPAVLENPCGPGKLYRGVVLSHRFTNKKDIMYMCKLETPLEHCNEFTATYTHKMMCSFVCAKEAEGWTVSPKTAQEVGTALVVGTCISRWFSLKELPGLAEDGALVGDFVDGIVVDTGKNGNKNTFKCSFDAPASIEQW